MNLFFTTDIRGDYAWFAEEEARHVVQVLRKRVGESVTFVDGQGGRYEGEIDETGKRHFVAKITARQMERGKRNFRLHMAVAPTKNNDRFEWFLEKAAEIGVDEITPIRCEHSERTKIRTERFEKIILAAMKQSLRAYLPKLNDLVDFEQFIKNPETHRAGFRYIAHCREEDLPHLKDNCEPGKDVTILVGPEGDFSLAEITLANAAGFKNISLGKARLRTETAGIVACHIVNLLNE